jgi:outer membrane protein assembly factor BamD (BamD/ComL family)
VTHSYKSITLIFCILVAACSSKQEALEQVEKPVDVLYTDALATALNENPKKAAPKFEEVERQHPFCAGCSSPNHGGLVILRKQ